MKDDGRLIWLHLDVVGDPNDPSIVGVASAITDATLETVIHGPAPDCSTAETRAVAEQTVVEFLSAHVAAGVAPLAGENTHRSRLLLARQMPALSAHVHYRTVDLDTLRLLIGRWRPDAAPPATPADLRGAAALDHAISVLRAYRATVFV